MSDLQARSHPYLQIRNLSHRYEQKLALRNISLAVAKSEILALLGPSGSGKSTLLAAIAGIVKPHTGEILVGGRNLLNLPPEARGLGMVFQDYALWPHMTVAQNVAFPLRARKYPSVEINDRVDEALRRVGNAALNPVLSGAKKGTLSGVDYISYGQIAKGESLAIHYPKEGTVVALRPIFVQKDAPHREEARKLVDFMLSDESQDMVAKTYLIPARPDIRAQRPAPGEFKMLDPDWDYVKKNQTQLVSRFRKEIVEQIIQKR